jgi:hypothetical protein
MKQMNTETCEVLAKALLLLAEHDPRGLLAFMLSRPEDAARVINRASELRKLAH